LREEGGKLCRDIWKP